MKKTFFLTALLVAIAAGSSALATDKPKATDQAKTSAPRKQEVAAKTTAPVQKERLITGSYIPQPVQRNGMITMGPNNVAYIDGNMMRVTGANNVSQLLRRTGVGGR
jgi:hypothetical protein